MLQKVNDRLMLTDTVYRVGKKLVQVVIPALSTLYFTLGSIWGLPVVDKVTGTLAAIATFIGVSLGLSSKQFDKSGAGLEKLKNATVHAGTVVIKEDEDTGRKLYSLEIDGDTDDLDQKSWISFKVSKE